MKTPERSLVRHIAGVTSLISGVGLVVTAEPTLRGAHICLDPPVIPEHQASSIKRLILGKLSRHRCFHPGNHCSCLLTNLDAVEPVGNENTPDEDVVQPQVLRDFVEQPLMDHSFSVCDSSVEPRM